MYYSMHRDPNFEGAETVLLADFDLGVPDDAIASGENKENGSNITWFIDAAGKLTVRGTGEISPTGGYTRAPWYSHRMEIKSAEVNVTGMTNASYLFKDCINLSSIDLSGFDTSAVTSMTGMFRNCKNLTSLDISNFNTNNVADMSEMFGECSNLKGIVLDSERFDTAKVTDMRAMFEKCGSLKSIDLSGFHTAQVTNMRAMFSGCGSLTALDLSSFETSAVANMADMFSGCNKLENVLLDVDKFNTVMVTDMGSMFEDCRHLKGVDVSHFDTAKVTNMGSMFSYCMSLTDLDVSSFDTSAVTDMPWMFTECRKLTKLDLSNFDTAHVTSMLNMFLNCYELTDLELGNSFVTGQVTSMSGMFADCGKLTGLDVSGFATGNVTSMLSMFGGCESLTALDVRHFDTGNVTDMGSMFQGCKSLTTLDVSGFDTNNVTNMKGLFCGCESLTALDVSHFDTGKATDMGAMFADCAGLTSLELQNFNTQNVTSMENMFGSAIGGSGSGFTSIDLSGFDTSNVTSMAFMFNGCKELTMLDLHTFDTHNVTDMSVMFQGCKKLKNLDLSKFDTSQVTGMGNMFFECESLENLDISFNAEHVTGINNMFSYDYKLKEIHTPKNLKISVELPVFSKNEVWKKSDETEITELPQNLADSIVITKVSKVPEGSIAYGEYKQNGSNVTWSIDSAGKLTVQGTGDYADPKTGGKTRAPWNGWKSQIKSADIKVKGISNASGMFYGCTELTSVDFTDSDFTDVTDMSGMFEKCCALTSLKWGSLNTGKVTDMSYMFYGCNALVSLDMSGFDTTGVTDMSLMFYGCGVLESLDVSGFDTSKVIDMSGMFYGCKGLSSLDVSNFKTQNVTNMRNMFDGSGCASLDVSSFNTSSVTNMSYMFNCCSELTTLDLHTFDTHNVTDMSRMFGECGKIKDLDLGSFDTGQVTGMEGMFFNCISLENLNISFNAEKVTDMNHIFQYDNKLEKIHTPYHLRLEVVLPVISGSVMWTDADGNQITKLPQNSDQSVLISKQADISSAHIYVSKIKTKYKCGDVLNLDDLTVTYYSAGNDGRKLKSDEYRTNASGIDMATPGNRILTVTYDDGFNILTYDISIEVAEKIVLTDDNILIDLKAREFVYDGTPKTPEISRVICYVDQYPYMLNAENGDYTVAYENNTDAFEAAAGTETEQNAPRIIITGHNDYSGTVSKTFTIKKAVAPDNVECTVTVGDCNTAHEGCALDLSEHFADYTDKEGYRAGTPVEDDTVAGSVILGKPTVDEKGILTYSTSAGAEGDFAVIPVTVSFRNHNDSLIYVRIILRSEGGGENPDYPDNPDNPDNPDKPAVPEVPSAQPASGTVDKGSFILLIADTGAHIYYTTDKSEPEKSPTAKLYEDGIAVDGDAGSVITIKAAAEKDGIFSKTVTFTYTVSKETVRGLQIMLAGSDEFTYTGSAIKPAVIVSNNGEKLTEGKDYTLRYANNVKAADKTSSKAPKVTVTGKGNLTKNISLTFTISPKDIGDEKEVACGSVMTTAGKTVQPVFVYNGVKLTTKDFTNPNVRKKYSADETVTITGKGNFTGTRDIDVRVVDAKSRKKFTVAIDNKALKDSPLVFDGTAKTMNGYFKVYDAADKSKTLEEGSGYMVVYAGNTVNAGKVKFTVIGIGDYYGTVTKTYTIRPKAVKEEGGMEVNVSDGGSYPYTATGAVIPGLKVSCGGKELALNRDYKVTYSGNRKVCSGNKAKCTISFLGNYKGSKAVVRRFNVIPAAMDDPGRPDETAGVTVADKIYTGKPGTYKSAPYVTVNGTLLKASDYKVSYYNDAEWQQPVNPKDRSSLVSLTDGEESRTVYVKIEGKKNYTGTLSAAYRVYKRTDEMIDISKAKVTFAGGNKAEYTGEKVTPAIEIRYKSGKTWITVDPADIDAYFTVTYFNHVNKGRATVLVNAKGDKYAGSRTAAFSIVAKNIQKK